MKNKLKKSIKFWQYYENTCISKDVKEEIKRLNRIYNKHRSRCKNK